MARRQRERFELPKARLALVIDQLEELFTSGFSPEVRQKYVSALAGLVRSGRVFVLATLRSDFYASYQEFPDLIELSRAERKIRSAAADAFRDREHDPVTGRSSRFAIRAGPKDRSTPWMRHCVSCLCHTRIVAVARACFVVALRPAEHRGDGLLRWSDYRELGELKGALAKHAEAVFGTLGPDAQGAFPLVMRHLVTLGQGEEEVPNRRTVPYRDLVATGEIGQDQKAGAKGLC